MFADGEWLFDLFIFVGILLTGSLCLWRGTSFVAPGLLVTVMLGRWILKEIHGEYLQIISDVLWSRNRFELTAPTPENSPALSLCDTFSRVSCELKKWQEAQFSLFIRNYWRFFFERPKILGHCACLFKEDIFINIIYTKLFILLSLKFNVLVFIFYFWKLTVMSEIYGISNV